ncbi:MAG: hypothetical protein AB1Z98_25005, partial [Nannocystaceae bacterium]
GDGELPLYMLERYGLPVTEEARARAEREAEQYERKFANRKTTWENRRDFGNWWQAEQEAKERREHAKARREERDQALRDRVTKARAKAAAHDPEEGSEGEGIDDEGALDPKP